MDPRKLFADERLSSFCVYCGAKPETRDHVPSKVLLDEPFPPNLPVVPACQECNNGFSSDELYLACLIDCAISGSVSPESVQRSKVARLLREHKQLAAVIERSRLVDDSGNQFWRPDDTRIKNVILKLARGHTAYDCSEPMFDEPKGYSVSPLSLMSEDAIIHFETAPQQILWPEIGSRAFVRSLVVGLDPFNEQGWQVIQPGRYRYLVDYSGSMTVRVVLSEYLACEVIW